MPRRSRVPNTFPPDQWRWADDIEHRVTVAAVPNPPDPATLADLRETQVLILEAMRNSGLMER
jgi:hypothetical protein